VIYDPKCWKVSTSVGDVLIPYAGLKFWGSIGYRITKLKGHFKKESVMTEKELERQNFLTWCKYASPEEVEKAKMTNKRTLERLLYKYADEIEKINNSKYVSKYMSQHNIGVQKLELSLEISK